MSADPTLPTEGSIFPLFSIFRPDGTRIDIADFRQYYNLVLLFSRNLDLSSPLLSALTEASVELESLEAIVIAVVSGAEPAPSRVRGSERPNIMIFHGGSEVLDRFCPGELSVYVTDRFREIFLARHDPEKPLQASGILDRLRFIEHQCPE